MHVCVLQCMSICDWVLANICLYVWVYVCLCKYVYGSLLCECVCMCMCVYMHECVGMCMSVIVDVCELFKGVCACSNVYDLMWVCAYRGMPVGECVYTSGNKVGQAHWVPASKGQSLMKHFNYIYLTEEPGGVQSGITHWALVSYLLTGAHKSHIAYRTALSAIAGERADFYCHS